MLFASSVSGSTPPPLGGSQLATLPTTIPPVPTRPPPGAPPPGVWSHCLPEEELSFRKALGQRILQQGTPLDPKESVHFVHSARKFAGAMPSWDWMYEVDWQMLGGVCAGNSGEVPLPLVIAQVIRRDVSLEKRVISTRRHGTHRNRKW